MQTEPRLKFGSRSSPIKSAPVGFGTLILLAYASVLRKGPPLLSLWLRVSGLTVIFIVQWEVEFFWPNKNLVVSDFFLLNLWPFVSHVPQLRRMTWLGHASVLAEVDGQTFLTDPIFSQRASAVQIAGKQPNPFHAWYVDGQTFLTDTIFSHIASAVQIP